ncbi:MAG: MarR family winged helix-turn-helix transcriptional regulator [Micropruina sp.]|uniref:MarR family winged helix-turn-helix transcriptional regulator n=1 Tax=Micropruina sp. TaxID=2737536 RepID=UPI0039E2221B
MDEVRWLSLDEQALWRSFILAQQDLDRVISADLAGSGLSHADYAVLVGLSEAGSAGVRVGRLREWIGWESSRLAHQLRRMESRGLVSRCPAAEDGRGTVVSITAEGRARIEAAAPGHVRTVRASFIDLMSESERQVLGAVFARVAAVIAPERGSLTSQPD